MALAGARLAAADSDGLPDYQPAQAAHGTVRSWGHGFLRPTLKAWEREFQRYQPGVQFDDHLATSAAAIAGLYSERADLGVLAREITPPETAAYEKMTGQKVFPVIVMAGSWGDQDRIMTLGVFVNRANPLARLTFSQLDAIWGAELRGGAPGRILTWDQLGLGDSWRHPIDLYSGPPAEAPGFFFSQTVMHGSVLWNDRLRPFENIEQESPSTGTESTAPHIVRTVDAYQRVVDAVGTDPDGMGLAGAGYRNPGAKLIALAVQDGGPFVAPSPESATDFTYPLARAVRFYLNAGPKLPPNPAVVEFLRFILSRQGQDIVRREGRFLPLTADIARREASRLP